AIYLKQTIWPAGLAVFYPHPANNWSGIWLMCSVLLLVAITVAAFVSRRRRPWLLAGWCWFVVALTPVIGIVQVGAQSHADRYTYLPHVGLALIIAGVGAALLQQRPKAGRRIIVAGTAACALLLTLATARQLQVWETSERLFAHALAVTKNNYVAHNNYGFAVRDSEPAVARAHFEAALALKPDYYDARINLGTSFFIEGDFMAALDQYLHAMQLDGSRADAFTNLGLTLARLQRRDEAIEAYKQALNRAPGDAVTRMYLADALFAQENWFHAAAQYDIALQIDPTLEQARRNREIALSKLERPET
ncbi:MAG: tetratricopeptide repeat protein, partial [Candidatus Hydrogenedentales bacterium]